MKSFIYFIGVVCLVGYGFAEIMDVLNLNEDELAEHKKLLDACYTVTGTNQRQINEFENNLRAASPENHGCLLACYSQAVGILKSNGDYDLSPVKRNLSPENYAIADSCWKQAPVGDLCQQTFEVYNCFMTSRQNN